MTKKLRHELAQRIADLDNLLTAIDQRLDGIVARIEWMQIEAARARSEYPTVPPPSDDAGLTTESVWATPAPRPWRFLNGSWPQRDGDTYPPFRPKGPLGGYESYVRRSPPASE